MEAVAADSKCDGGSSTPTPITPTPALKGPVHADRNGKSGVVMNADLAESTGQTKWEEQGVPMWGQLEELKELEEREASSGHLIGYGRTLDQAAAAAQIQIVAQSGAAALPAAAGEDQEVHLKSSTLSDASQISQARPLSEPVLQAVIHCSTPRSIYGLWTERQRYIILGVVSTATLMVPFCDTIYLPALPEIEEDLHATGTEVALTVSLYMFMVGLMSLFWGPSSDRFGRRINYQLSMAAFLATSLGCIFAPSITLLIIFRTLQGASVASFVAVGGGVVADIFPPEQRGFASGLFMITLLVGPVVGPLVGGGLAEAFGWRSTFIFLTVFAGVVIAPLVIFKLPETLQYTKLLQLGDSAAADIKEAEDIMANPPVFLAPWVPLKFLLEPAIAPHAAVAFFSFGAMFASLTEMPGALAEAPYSLSPSLLGVTYLPQGIGALIACPIAGRLSDYAALQHPDEPESRLIYSTVAALVISPAALLLYGWSLQAKLNLSVALVAQFFIGAGCAFYLPGLYSYLSNLKQSESGAAIAAAETTICVAAGIMIVVSSVVVQAIGIGPFFTIMAACSLVTALTAYIIIVGKRRASHDRQKLTTTSKEVFGDDGLFYKRMTV